MTPFANMTYLRASHRALWMGAALALPMLTTISASADVACGDTTCPSGFVCQTYQAYDCPTQTAPAVNKEGSDSDAAAAEAERIAATSCTPKPGYTCVPAPCSVDADCGSNMVCNEYESSECSGGAAKPACAPDVPDCVYPDVEPEAPVCTTTTVKQCAYRYTLPCKTAADCGAGFTCEDSIACSCSGSRGTASEGGSTSTGTAIATPGTAVDSPVPSDDADTSGSTADGGSTGVASDGDMQMPAEPADPSCSCASTGVFHCKLQTIACGADADCPAGLVCLDVGQTDCAVSSDGNTSCPAVAPAKTCQAPYYQRGGVDLSDEAASNSGTTTGASSTEPPKADTDNAGPTSPADGTLVDAADPSAAENGSEPADVSGGGCSVARSAAKGHWLLLALASGLALLRPTMRSRKRI